MVLERFLEELEFLVSPFPCHFLQCLGLKAIAGGEH